ncbi:MAG: hypothetical protein HYX79_00810 [Chloroflexi bacterium]|nr:hypothetical protein [Chloroflexota bacterium]
MAEKPVIYAVWMKGPARREREWNEWLNRRHLPDRLTVPGFLSAQRFVASEGEPKYIDLYSLADAGVLNSKPYLAMRARERSKDDPDYEFMALTEAIPGIHRGFYEQIFPDEYVFLKPQSDVFLMVGLDVPADKEEEFNAWYNTEHIPEHLKVPGFLRATRFISIRDEVAPGRKADGPKYVTIWEVENEKVFLTPEYEKSRFSPWTYWLRRFYVRRIRAIYRRVF